MDPAPRPNSSSSRLDRALTVLLLLGAVGYSIFLYRNGSPHAAGADSSGYLNTAHLLEQGQFFGAVRAPAGHGHASFSLGAFQPLGFTVDPKVPRMAPTYPLGLPLHLLVAAQLGGWDRAALLVNVFAALGSGGLLWLLARHLGFPPAWAAVAVGWLWLCPQFVFCALQPMSDSLALLWSLAVLYPALRSRDGVGWCLACGAALALAVLVRPTNALLFLPVLAAVGFQPLRLLWLGLGGVPGAIFLGYYNYRVYGAVVTTGYGDVGSAFSTGYLLHNLGPIFRWIPGLLSPLVGAVLAWPFLPGRSTREARILAGWALLLIGFYAFYFHTGETWWYLRFLLPAFPLLILGAIAVWRKIPARTRAGQVCVLGAVLVLSAAWEIKFNRILHPVGIAAEERSYRQSADWARQHLPADSAIFCMQVSGAFYFYTDFLLVRWDQIEPAYIGPLLQVLQDQHRPVYAMLYEFERPDALPRLGGKWTELAKAGHTTVWRLDSSPASP